MFVSKKCELIYLSRNLKRFNIIIIVNLKKIIKNSKINIKTLSKYIYIYIFIY